MNRPDFDRMSKQEQRRFRNHCGEYLHRILAANKRMKRTANIINESEVEESWDCMQKKQGMTFR